LVFVVARTRDARRILRQGYGFRYRSPQYYDLEEVVRFEVEELNNFHILEEAQGSLGICPGVRAADFSEALDAGEAVDPSQVDACLSDLFVRLKSDFREPWAVWLTATPEQAAWYAPRHRTLDVDRYGVPKNAFVLSDLGKGGVLLVSGRQDWEEVI